MKKPSQNLFVPEYENNRLYTIFFHNATLAFAALKGNRCHRRTISQSVDSRISKNT